MPPQKLIKQHGDEPEEGLDLQELVQYAKTLGHEDPLARLLQALQPEQDWPPLSSGPLMKFPGGNTLTTPEKAMILQSLIGSNTATSQQTICAKFRKYYKYCSDLKVSPLPLNQARICLYIKHLEKEKTVKPKYFGQYVSSLSTVAAWLGVDNSALTSENVRRCLRSALIQTVGTAATDQIAVIGTTYLVDLISRGLQTEDASELRVITLMVWQVMWMSRESSSTYVRLEDVKFQDSHNSIQFREMFFKGKRAVNHVNRVRHFQCGQSASLYLLLQRYMAVRESLWASTVEPRSLDNRIYLWAFPTDGKFSSRILSHWFTSSSFCPHNATLHCLRKSGATSAYNAGVPMERICAWGGWAVGSRCLDVYIDYTRPADPHDTFFFGWLVTGVPTFLTLVPTAPESEGEGIDGTTL